MENSKILIRLNKDPSLLNLNKLNNVFLLILNIKIYKFLFNYFLIISFSFKITESESYRKYLFHKDMNEHRLRDEINELKPTVAQAVRDMTHIRVEEQKTEMKERLQNWRNLYESKPPINQELEELKQKYFEEIEMIKQQQLEDKESYEKEKEEWLAQRAEIEQELNNLKNKLNDKKAELPSISYDIRKFILLL